jgi:DNA-binding MarR family transcriptional regulator
MAAKKAASRAIPTLLTTSRSALLDRSTGRAADSDQTFRTFVDGLVRLSARMQALRAALAAHMELSPPKYSIALVLAHEPNGLRVVDVAARLELSVTFVTTEIGRMERSGLVQRRENPDDRRSSIIGLSRKGQALLARGAPYLRSVNDRLFASLTRAQMVELTEVLARIGADAQTALKSSRVQRAPQGRAAARRGRAAARR